MLCRLLLCLAWLAALHQRQVAQVDCLRTHYVRHLCLNGFHLIEYEVNKYILLNLPMQGLVGSTLDYDVYEFWLHKGPHEVVLHEVLSPLDKRVLETLVEQIEQHERDTSLLGPQDSFYSIVYYLDQRPARVLVQHGASIVNTTFEGERVLVLDPARRVYSRQAAGNGNVLFIAWGPVEVRLELMRDISFIRSVQFDEQALEVDERLNYFERLSKHLLQCEEKRVRGLLEQPKQLQQLRQLLATTGRLLSRLSLGLQVSQ